jgi:hypothetical protein
MDVGMNIIRIMRDHVLFDPTDATAGTRSFFSSW